MTFWHGVLTWAGAGLCILAVWGDAFFSEIRETNWSAAIGKFLGILAALAWTAFVLFGARSIAG